MPLCTCGGQCASVYQQLKMHKAAGDDLRDILHTSRTSLSLQDHSGFIIATVHQ